MQLFDRRQRPLKLTIAGEAYIEMIRKTHYLEEELTQQINDIKDLKTGNILIGGSHYLNAYILPDILMGFSQKYPGIKIKLMESSSAELAEKLEQRKLDLTFSCNPRFMQNFERYPAFHDRVLLAVPSNLPAHLQITDAALTATKIANGCHLQHDCPTVSLSQFRDLEFILLSEGNNLYDRCIQMFAEAGFEPKIKMVLSQLVTAFHLAESGYGATFVSDRLVSAQANSLLFYKLNSEAINRQFYILLPHRSYTSYAVKRFIDHFTQAIRHYE